MQLDNAYLIGYVILNRFRIYVINITAIQYQSTCVRQNNVHEATFGSGRNFTRAPRRGD